MATSLTEAKSSEMETVTFSFPISKMETDADGDLVVKGVATDGSVDSDYQIVDPEWSAKALGDWLATGGNVRMAHDPQRPVGKGLSVEIDRDGDGKHWVKSVIVDPVAKRLVEKGILRAYSVGISHPVIKRDPSGKAPGGIIMGGELSELSIVDRPANKNSYLELAKSAGANKMEITGILHEGASENTISKASGTFSPADLAKLIEHRRVAEKRDFDPNVGGGVDRDKMPASDFVDPKGRRFPIHSASDVSDAVSSYGRAKPKIPFDKFKRRVTAIARRKGFESSLPEEWKKGGADSKKYAGAMQANPPQTPPMPGQVPAPAQHQAPAPHPAAPTGHPAPPAGPQHQAAPQHAPGAPQQPVQGPQDGAQPQAQPMLAKDHMAATGHQVQPGMGFCPDCGSPMGNDAPPMDPMGKGDQPPADPTDSNGHMTIDMPMQSDGANKADVPNSGSVGEPQMTTPVESVSDAKKKPGKQGKPKSLDAKTEAYAKKPKKNGKIPTPKEAPSTDALPGVGKSVGDPALETAMLLKQLDVPSDLGALHDLLCPGFHPADSEKCHPAQSLKSLDVARWQAEALTAAATAPLDEAARATERWQAAESIKSMAITDPAGLLELRHEAHKSFSDAQIGPGTAPVPTQIRAGQFKKPYLTEGHARQSMQAEGPNTHEVPTNSLAASQFTDGYLSAGHADESPSNKSRDARPIDYPEMTGRVKALDYSGASRQAAKAAMDAIHDHIAHTFPDLCPIGSPGLTEELGKVPMGETKIPQPVGAEKSEAPAEITKAYGAAEITDLIKSMKDEFSAELGVLTKALKAEQKRNKKLQATVDSMASMPDPTVAAFKGVALTHPINKGAAVSARTVAETAEQTQLMMMRELETQWRTSDNPAQREAAWASLMKMRGMA